VLGGLFAWRAARIMGAPTMILAIASATALSAWLTYRLGAGIKRAVPRSTPAVEPPAGILGGSRPPPPPSEMAARSAFSGLRTLRESSHLRDLALLIGLGAISGALFDVALSTEAAAALRDRDELLSFFAGFHLTVGLLSFALQTTVASKSLERFGLAGTVGILPGVVLTSALSLAVAPRLWVAAIVRGSEAVLRNSLFRSGYELLYTPVPLDQKRSVKTLIDVGFDRIGTAVGSGLAMLALAFAPHASLPTLIGAGAAAAGVTLLLTPRLDRSYVAALAESLRSGSVSLDPTSVVDATTRRTLSGTIDALSRDKILAEIAALRKAASARVDAERSDAEVARDRPSHGGAASAISQTDVSRFLGGASVRALAEGPRSARSSLRMSGEGGASDPLLAAIADLRSGDLDPMRRVLARELDPALISHVVPLLAREKPVRDDAIRALRKVAARVTGQLVDALLDPAMSFAVRRRIPRVLQACVTQRAADGLMLGLADGRFEVRYQCGIALSRIVQQGAPVALRHEDVMAAALREINADRQLLEAAPSVTDSREPSEAPAAERLIVERTNRSLEHIFRVLSLSLDREPLEIAYRAHRADDPHLRGTALEYLENVLPEPIRVALWPYLDARPRPATAPRPAQQALAELLRSSAALPPAPLSVRSKKERRT
jgi:ATP:ADP antiporter, AAA family